MVNGPSFTKVICILAPNSMLIIVIIIAAFLILYLMMFLRQNKDRRENEINAVEEFRNNYGKRNENFSQNNILPFVLSAFF